MIKPHVHRIPSNTRSLYVYGLLMGGVALFGLAIYVAASRAFENVTMQRELAAWQATVGDARIEGARLLLARYQTPEEPLRFLEDATREPGREGQLVGLEPQLREDPPPELRLLAARLAWHRQDWARAQALFQNQRLVFQDSLRVSLCQFASGQEAQALADFSALYARRPGFVLQVLPRLERRGSPWLLPVLATAAWWSLEGNPSPRRLLNTVASVELKVRLLGTVLRSLDGLDAERVALCRSLLSEAESLHLMGRAARLPPLDPWGLPFTVSSDSPHVRSQGLKQALRSD